MAKLKLLFFLILLIPSFILISCSSISNNFANNKSISLVTKIFDGDSFEIDDEQIRLFGVDTPEIDYNLDDITQYFANRAKDFTSNLISNKEVELEILKSDFYNRLVAKVYFNDIDIGYELVKNGLARVAYISLRKGSPFYTDDFMYLEKLLNAQYDAHINKLGFWQTSQVYKKIFTNQTGI